MDGSYGDSGDWSPLPEMGMELKISGEKGVRSGSEYPADRMGMKNAEKRV